jgi:hypothetical protein
MNKGKAKKNMKGNKRFTKRRHCGRKKNTRNLRKKRGNVTRRRGRKIIGGDPPNYIEEYLLSETDTDKDTSYINKNDGRTYVKVNDFGDDDIRNNEILDKLLKNKYFFVDYLDERDNDDAKKLELGYYKGLLMEQVTGKLQEPVTIMNPVYSQLLRFVTTNGTQQNIPRRSQYVDKDENKDEKFYPKGEELIKDFNSNIIDKLYYYPLTTRIKSGIDSFRKTLPNYPKIPTFSFGISSNKNIVSEVVKNDKDDLRERSSTASTYSDDDSDSREKIYELITTIDDMKEKIKEGKSFAKLDGNGNYIDYSLCRVSKVSRRNDEEFLCDIDDTNTDTIQAHHIADKKIFYF